MPAPVPATVTVQPIRVRCEECDEPFTLTGTALSAVLLADHVERHEKGDVWCSEHRSWDCAWPCERCGAATDHGSCGCLMFLRVVS